MNFDVTKRALIIKNPKIKINAHDCYIEVYDYVKPTIISYKHISVLYINKTSNIKLSTILKISSKIPVQIIDHNGYFLAKIQMEKNNASK